LLTSDEEASSVIKAQKATFMEEAYSSHGPAAKEIDFPEDAITPDHDYYQDKEEGFEGTPDKILPPTPEVNDN
jgi:hypothetical protein